MYTKYLLYKYNIKKKIRKYMKTQCKDLAFKDFEIKGKNLTIHIDKAVMDLKEEDLLKLYALVRSFIKTELKNNELNNAWLQIKYSSQWDETEYINIFNLIRKCRLFADFSLYFEEFEERLNKQSNDTKIDIDDYLTSTQITEQKISIEMIFPIEMKNSELNEKRALLEQKMKKGLF